MELGNPEGEVVDNEMCDLDIPDVNAIALRLSIIACPHIDPCVLCKLVRFFKSPHHVATSSFFFQCLARHDENQAVKRAL
jgi:hypothetical protein